EAAEPAAIPPDPNGPEDPRAAEGEPKDVLEDARGPRPRPGPPPPEGARGRVQHGHRVLAGRLRPPVRPRTLGGDEAAVVAEGEGPRVPHGEGSAGGVRQDAGRAPPSARRARRIEEVLDRVEIGRAACRGRGRR